MMKLISAMLLLAGAVDACGQMSTYSLNFKVSSESFPDTVAIDYATGRVVVPVQTDGQTLRFLLDTGASQTTVYSDTPISNTQSAGFTVSRDAMNVADTVSKVVLPPLTIGKTTFTGCQAVVQKRVARQNNIDGILGFDLFNWGLQAKIDTRQRQMVITTDRNFFDGEPGCEWRYKLNYHVPYITVSPFARYKEQALFDTGSRMLYIMNKESFDKGERKARGSLAQQVESRTTGRWAMGHGGVEKRGEVVFMSLDSVAIGRQAIRQVRTLTTMGASKIGAELLRHGTLVIAPHRKAMRFCPYDGAGDVVVANTQIDKAIIQENDMAVVGLVREGSTPYQAGLREGDVIIKVDSRELSSFAEYMAFVPEKDKVYTFVVRNTRGFLKEVKMPF